MIVRVRRISGIEGGRHDYHHADIICKNKKEALVACKNGSVSNWRWIDSFDVCKKSYVKYDVLYEVDEKIAENPETPKGNQMKAEKEILHKIKFLEKLMKKYEKDMNSKVRITEASLEKHEEAEELYYECVVEINALKWVLGVR